MSTKFYRPTAPEGPSWRHLAVGPIPPADWGTRSTRSHLGKRPEHEILLLVDRGVGPGVRRVLGQLWGLGSSRFLAGFRPAVSAGPRGRAKAAPPRGKNSPQEQGGGLYASPRTSRSRSRRGTGCVRTRG
jgi:hypothetical protein